MGEIASSRAAGQHLADRLRGGWRPPPVTAPFRLEPDEVCYSAHDAEVWQLLEGDGAWVQKRTFGIGIVPFAMMAGNAVGNRRRKRSAGREAEARFRPVDGGPMFLTSQRLAVQGHRWTDLWYPSIRNTYCDEGAVTLELSGSSPVQLRVSSAYWVFTLLRFAAWGEIVAL